MAFIKIKSSLTGEIDLVSESAYKSYFEPTHLFTIVEEQKVKKEPEVEKPLEKPKQKPKTK